MAKKLYNAAGTEVDQATFVAALDEVEQEARFTVDQNYTQEFTVAGSDTVLRKLAFVEGQVISQTQVDNLFAEPTISAVSPAAAAAAGGTTIVITGTNFYDLIASSPVKLGGTACTSVVVNSTTQITCVTPAKTAGTYAVTVQTDAGTATKSNAVTTS